MFGYPLDGLLGCNILTLADKEQQDLLREEALTFRREPENSVFILGVEVTALRADGSNLLIHCKARPIEIRGEEQYICMIRDVSGLKEIHEKLMRTKHLASLGEMGASIAHEIRNPLAGISGAVQVLSDLSSVEKPDYLVLKEIRLLTERIEETVVRMLEYAKDWQLEPRLCRITELVEETVAAYNRQAKFEDISIEIVGCKDAKALIDPDLIGQVLVNLIENAVDACNGKGKLIWRIEKGLQEVSVSLQDNGAGVTDEVKVNIFKPFFTTKESGNGLGLAICQKIVEKHNGTISVKSKIGVGTRVTIVLPQSKFLKA
jgi:two-component system sensor histidine kinase HydH